MIKPSLHIPFLIALSLLLFALNIGGYDLWPPDEPRFAEVAREMRQSGDYLVPRVNGEPYKEKPPLLFWAMAAASLPFDDVTPIPARLPSVLAGVMTVLITYLLARKLYDDKVAFWAAVIMATSQRFWWQARFGQIDMLLTACLSLALLAFWLWHENRNAKWLVVFYASIAAAVYAKGPPGIVFPACLVFTFYWKDKASRRKLHFFVGLAAVALLIAIWLIPARMAASSQMEAAAGGAIGANLYRQIIGRIFLGVSHAHGPFYFMYNLPIDLMPWALFLPWTLPWVWKRRKQGPEMRLLLSWTVPAFIFFSICSGKRALYLLPLFPALSILLSASILDLMDSDRRKWRRNTALAWLGMLLVFTAAPFAIFFSEYSQIWNNNLVILSAVCLLAAIQTAYAIFKTELRDLHTLFAKHIVVILVCAVLIIFPMVNAFKSAKDFCEPVRTAARAGNEFDLYSVLFSREEFVYYSEHFHEPIMDEAFSLDVETTPEELDDMQDDMRRVIQKMTGAVEIGSIQSPSEQELAELAEAFQNAESTEEFQPALMEQYKQILTEESGKFVSNFASESPAFLIVQERDWRWFAAINPEATHFKILKNRTVGSRHVLLIANEAGFELTKKQ